MDSCWAFGSHIRSTWRILYNRSLPKNSCKDFASSRDWMWQGAPTMPRKMVLSRVQQAVSFYSSKTKLSSPVWTHFLSQQEDHHTKWGCFYYVDRLTEDLLLTTSHSKPSPFLLLRLQNASGSEVIPMFEWSITHTQKVLDARWVAGRVIHSISDELVCFK